MKKSHKIIYISIAILGMFLFLLSFAIQNAELLIGSLGILFISWWLWRSAKSDEELGGWGVLN